jgi:hypothetical protein
MLIIYCLAAFICGVLVMAVVVLSGGKTNYNKGYMDGVEDTHYLWENGKPNTTDENEII